MQVQEMFQLSPLSKTELDVLTECFTNPTTQKYLLNLLREDTYQLATLGALNLKDDELAKRHILITGRIEVYSTLLSIQKGNTK